MIFKELSNKEISILSKFIVYHCFRNGVIEDIHGEGRISEDEIKEIVKSSVTELATVIYGLTHERGPYTWDSRWNHHEIQKSWDDPDWKYVKNINETVRKEPFLFMESMKEK